MMKLRSERQHAILKSPIHWNTPAGADDHAHHARCIQRPVVHSMAAEVTPMQSHPSHAYGLRWIMLLLLAGCAFQASARDRYSYFYNDGNDATRSVQVKQQDVDRWTDVDVGDGVGSGKAKKVHLHAESHGRCLYDVKTTFEKGPALLHRQMDCASCRPTPRNATDGSLSRVPSAEVKRN